MMKFSPTLLVKQPFPPLLNRKKKQICKLIAVSLEQLDTHLRTPEPNPFTKIEALDFARQPQFQGTDLANNKKKRMQTTLIPFQPMKP